MPRAKRRNTPDGNGSDGRARRFSVAKEIELLAFLLSPPLELSRKRAKDLLRFGAVSVAGGRVSGMTRGSQPATSLRSPRG